MASGGMSGLYVSGCFDRALRPLYFVGLQVYGTSSQVEDPFSVAIQLRTVLNVFMCQKRLGNRGASINISIRGFYELAEKVSGGESPA